MANIPLLIYVSSEPWKNRFFHFTSLGAIVSKEDPLVYVRVFWRDILQDRTNGKFILQRKNFHDGFIEFDYAVKVNIEDHPKILEFSFGSNKYEIKLIWVEN